MFNIERLNVQDEIPSGNIRFDIKTNGGATLYSNVDISMVTEILQEGTPLNKALHDKIDYIGECVSSLDDVGKDIEKFIADGEIMGIKLLQIDGKEYELLAIKAKFSAIESSISSLQSQITSLQSQITALGNRVTNLEERVSDIERAI